MFMQLSGWGDVPARPTNESPADVARQREELVRRVGSSATFEKSPRLRAFFLHVCQCALENKPEEATEQQIGIHVYERSPGYNPNEDNVVRTAARLLRMKLEHHFANEGKDEPIVISIPKGRYLPVFEPRSEQTVPHARLLDGTDGSRRARRILFVTAMLFGAVVWLGYELFNSRASNAGGPVNVPGAVSKTQPSPVDTASAAQLISLGSGHSEIRIAAGRPEAYVDVRGRRWEADRYYSGGASRSGPLHFFPPVADPGLFKTVREATVLDAPAPQWFRYDVPLSPGVYELRLYFADPLRQPQADHKEGAQNIRHFQVNLNGQPLLVDFDPVADAGTAAVSVRVFKDVVPAKDGKLHLEFSGRPCLSALEVTPGTPGKLKPIRIAVLPKDVVDDEGTNWSADDYFVEGRTLRYANPEAGPKVPVIYSGERHGNFSYAIPVASGSYTIKLHFMEGFFSPLIPGASCRGAGCRVFDVTCNGVMLLQDFDIYQAAPGAFQPVVREFHGLHPNGQGKLVLSFSPKVNYGEIRAIEVIDEAE